MKKIFLHIGPPKTGTTFLQNTFPLNIANLNNSNIYYPHVRTDGKTQTGNISASSRSDFGNLRGYLENEVTNNKFDNILFSSEYLFELFSKNIPDLINFCNFFKTKGFEIHLVMCIRDVNSHCRSVYAQRIKNGRYTVHKSIEDFLLDSYDYPQLILKILETCEAFKIPCHAFKYDKNDLLRNFSTAIGLDFDLTPHPQGKLNRSLSTNELMILSAFQHFPPQKLRNLTWALVELVPNLHSHKYKCATAKTNDIFGSTSGMATTNSKPKR